MRAHVVVLTVGLLAAGPRSTRALDASRQLTQFADRSWSVRDGLPQSNVTALAQTPDGYLWVGTDGGLARFDGRQFTVFDASNTPALRIHRIRALRVDTEGALWVTSEGGPGLARYRDGRFEHFEQSAGLRGVAAVSLMQDAGGDLWAGAWWGVLRFSAGQFTRLHRFGPEPIGGVTAMAQDPAGAYWFGGDRGLLRVEGGRARRFSREDGLPSAAVTALQIDPQGGLWIATDGVGLLHHRDGRFRRILGEQKDTAANPDGRLAALRLDRQGTLWVAGERGLGRLGATGIDWAPPASPLSDAANEVLEDREGNLWVGRVSAGLLRVSQGPFSSLPAERFGGRRTKALLVARDGALWVGSQAGGVTRVHDGVYRSYRAPTTGDGLCTDSVRAIAEDRDGAIWFGGMRARTGSLCRFDPATGTFQTYGRQDGFPPNDVHALAALPDGGMVVGAGVGIYRGDARRFARVPGPPGVVTNNVTAVHLDRRGTLWASAADGLLALAADGGSRYLTRRQGLSNGWVMSIAEDASGRLWLGTLAGFTRIDQGRTTAWTRAQGFLDDPVFKVLVDAQQNLWLCSSKGVFRVTAQAIARFDADPSAPLSYTRYGSDDGLEADQCETAAAGPAQGTDTSRRFWFGTARGAASLDPLRLPVAPAIANPVIEAVAAEGGRQLPGPSRALEWRTPAGRGDLQFAYAAPMLSHPERLRFRYRLDPFDRHWIEAGERRTAYYTNIAPGSYRFRVTVADGAADVAGSAVPGPEATVTLELTPRWFQTWWMRAIWWASLLALAVLVLRLWHQRRLQALEDRHVAILTERNRIARDLHDTLAQGFTGISVQLEAATGHLPSGMARALENLDQARALVRASLADARRAVWDLRPMAAERGDLIAALSEIARNLGAGVPVRVQVSGTPRALPAAMETALVRIGQEALTNALRHAHATNIALEISFLQQAVRVRVSDDGQGFDPAQVQGRGTAEGGLGLEGLRERAGALGAQLEVRSRPGAGTELSVTTPYPADPGA